MESIFKREKAQRKGRKERVSFLRMCFFFSLFFFAVYFIGAGNSLANGTRTDKTAIALPYIPSGEKKESFHEFICYKNLSYPSSFPNHYYDAYLIPEGKKKLGTIIYVHGGGFVSGTKDVVWESPYFLKWLRAGFQVISVDYALAPDYPYPTSLHQLSYCVQKILDEKVRLGIDAKKLIFMGDSAGASLAGQFILTQVNKSYGKKLAVPSFVSERGGKISAFISLSGLLDCTRFNKTGLLENDESFLAWGRAYFKENDFAKGKKARDTNLANFLTKDFPPTFLTDGTVGSFRDQAIDFKEKCQAVGVPVCTFFPEGDFKHDYELHMDTAEAEESLEKQVHFATFLLS